MEIRTIKPFLEYIDSIHERTVRAARCIPADKLESPCAPGKFTPGDLLRHIAVTKRFMFAETVLGHPHRYTTENKQLADGLDNVLALLERLHAESREILSRLSDADLQGLCTTPTGAQIPVWVLLRAMTEHEIHHRGEVYHYLGLFGVPAPPLFGATSEQVKAAGIAL